MHTHQCNAIHNSNISVINIYIQRCDAIHKENYVLHMTKRTNARSIFRHCGTVKKNKIILLVKGKVVCKLNLRFCCVSLDYCLVIYSTEKLHVEKENTYTR